jgi:hypothetical protein
VEQARDEDVSVASAARFDELVAEIVPKLRRLGPELSERALMESAARLAEHRLAGERSALTARGRLEPPGIAATPHSGAGSSVASPAESSLNPLDDERVRALVVALTHRLRATCGHLSEGELIGLATRMARLELGDPPAATPAGQRASAGGSTTPARPAVRALDPTTIAQLADRYAQAAAVIVNHQLLGCVTGAIAGYLSALGLVRALSLQSSGALTIPLVVLAAATMGLMAGRRSGRERAAAIRDGARTLLEGGPGGRKDGKAGGR